MATKTLDYKYVPIIVKLQKGESSIFSEEPNVNFSSNVDYPRSEFGFHHFIHASKNKLEILKKFEGKKKVYLIHNQFEPRIDEVKSSIESTTSEKFKISEVERNFYKMWEILSIFGLHDNSSVLTSAHLGESTGGFVQAVAMYREEYAKKISKSDKYHVEFDKIKLANKSTQDSIKSKITSQKSIDDAKCNLVTSDINISVQNLNIYEQYASEEILLNIIKMSNLLVKGGAFVCKFYETFTITSMKIMSVLVDMFENVYFVKPMISELSDAEKYAVCVGFKQDKKAIASLNMLLKKIESKQPNMHIVDLFEDYQLNRQLFISAVYMNCVIANYQFKSINNMVNFIKKEIYFGEEFHDKSQEQLECSKYWIQMFYSSKTYPDMVETLVKNSNKEIKDLDEKIVTNV